MGRLSLVALVAVVLGPVVWLFNQGAQARVLREELQWYSVVVGAIVGCGGLLMLAGRAATTVTREKERQTWNILLSTTLEPSEIVLAKIAGNLYAARGLAALLTLLWALPGLFSPTFLMALPFSLATLLVAAVFVTVLGICFSLWCNSSLRALAATLTLVLWIGGGYLFCFLGGFDGAWEFVLPPCLPFLLAWPGIDAFNIYRGSAFTDIEQTIAYAAGVAGYAAASAVLWRLATANFDRWSRRA